MISKERTAMDDLICDTIQYTAGQGIAGRDVVAVESPLQININDKPFSMTMRTPGCDRYLVRGLLFTEGILSDKAAFDYTEKKDDDPLGMVTACVKLPTDWQAKHIQNRTLMSSAACGICGKTTWEDTAIGEVEISATAALDILCLPNMFKAMHDQQKMFHASGGTHASAAFSANGQLLAMHEDVGRHNAVDKVVGELLTTKKLAQTHCLLVSGRVSYEIVAKAYRAEIGHLAAVSAPTSLAIQTARRVGISLIGFARGKRATVYTRPQQIISSHKEKTDV